MVWDLNWTCLHDNKNVNQLTGHTVSGKPEEQLQAMLRERAEP